MIQLGIDLGSSTIKLVLIKENKLHKTWIYKHHGRVLDILQKGLHEIGPLENSFALCITGNNSQSLASTLSEDFFIDDIPAIIEGIRFLHPQAGSIISIGSQSSRFITEIRHKAPRFHVNEHCAGGTGSFFEDQMSRLGLNIEDYSRLCDSAESIPRLSGRCAVFAKTDIIHRQQEGVSTPDILLGLCYAMIRNYKAAIVRDLPLEYPLVLCGGITQNTGVLRAVKDIFSIPDNEMIISEYSLFADAIGAAAKAYSQIDISALLAAVTSAKNNAQAAKILEPLSLREGTILADPVCKGSVTKDDCILGIDIGSTSTNLVIINKKGDLLDFQYLRTAGNPELAVRQGLNSIRTRYGELPFNAVGITGSGRERLGEMIGADTIKDEITAQAKAASHCYSDVDTVFEIGGQDSKYISIKNGQITDFQMNKICAAGTGSFIEEQAARMEIPIQKFGEMALKANAPQDLGERCTVFIETAIASAVADNISTENIAAGLCHSIIKNYLHKVVGSKPVGNHIVLQGAVAYNPGIVAAFQQIFGKRINVSPLFSVSGAYGAALLAAESIGSNKSTFKGFDFEFTQNIPLHTNDTVTRNKAFYQKANQLLLADYSGSIDPDKQTIGVPYVLVIHKFFPMVNAFFKSLGFNVLLSSPTNEETIRLSQQYASGETCYPVKLIWGHMAELAAKKVDYIFLPSVHTMKHECSHVKHNYGCVYMQTAPRMVADSLRIHEKGITLLNPVFNLDFGKEAMAASMIEIGKQLGIAKPLCMKALLAGSMAVRKHTQQVEAQGKELLQSLKPDDKVLVLVTRNYGLSDPVLNMGIPKILLERGHKVITLSHLPAHDLDISPDHPNLYWPFGQHIISGIKMIANHPNLYAVYLTNHGCGPDSMLSHLVRKEMGNKPYLQIEVDEHFSSVGIITRIEAFLNTLAHRPTLPLPDGFDIKKVKFYPSKISFMPNTHQPLYIPDFGYYTKYLSDYFKQIGIHVKPAESINAQILSLGRAETNSKEYLPFPALLGSVLSLNNKTSDDFQFLIPFTEGAEADGQYAQAISSILHQKELTNITIAAPVLETLLQTAPNPDLLFRALLTGDLLYAAPSHIRSKLAPLNILSYDELKTLAANIGKMNIADRKISAVGTPMCLTSLNENILDALENKGNAILRAPLSEYMWFLWHDSCTNKEAVKVLEYFKEYMLTLGTLLENRNHFSTDYTLLISYADKNLSDFAGGNGRYRFAKAIDAGNCSDAVMMLHPRYENTSMSMELQGLHQRCSAPIYSIALDGDWDKAAWTRLLSFLYYC